MKAVFLDRDGVLNKSAFRNGNPVPPNPEEFELETGAKEGCKALKTEGFLLVVATNQPDVGRGTKPKEEVEEIHRRLKALIPEIDEIKVCYDAGDGESDRRKPGAGMLREAADELGISLADSWMVGDRDKDIACGQRAGCKTVLIGEGKAGPGGTPRHKPTRICKNLQEAAEAILGEEQAKNPKT